MQAHLGTLAPTQPRNARPGDKTYDYVREYIKLRQWALSRHGRHDLLGSDDRPLPRITRGDAITMARWWDDVATDIHGAHQLSREVRDGLVKMQVPAYGSAAAAEARSNPTNPDARLSWAQADYFWEGMAKISAAIGAAKQRPTLFDKGVLLFESFAEAAEELPGRIADAGKDLADDLRGGLDTLTTVAKWTGILGAGVLTVIAIHSLASKPQKDD